MKNKDIKYNDDARKKMMVGIEKLEKAVAVTLGPSGRNVIIENDYESPSLTKDGVTVANSIKLEDSFENLGAQIVKQAASQTAKEAGDGTTTSTILAYHIIKDGLIKLSNECNVIDFKNGMDKAKNDIIEELSKYAKNIENDEQIKQIATISANNDPEIGGLIASAMERVGRDGVITVEDSKTAETSLEVVEGMQFSRGYLSPYFITNNDLMQVQLENARILCYDGKIHSIKSIKRLLETAISNRSPLLIIAEDLSSEILSTLVVNKMRGTMQIAAVKAPEYGARRTQYLEDIAILTNGNMFSPTKGDELEKINFDLLGSARLITIDNEKTTIIDGRGDSTKILERITDIKKQIDKPEVSDYDKQKLQERLAKLTGGIAIINVGANTEIELKEKKYRIDDALHATKAAIEEGILPGGGIALLNIYKAMLAGKILGEYVGEDEKQGYLTVFKSLQTPFNVILENGGIEPIRLSIDIDMKQPPIKVDEYSTFGYNLKDRTFVDMIEAGIIDPAKVTRVALEKAISVAGTILTTEAAIVNIPEKNKNNEQNMEEMYQ